jgi:hypothetical protein
MHGVCRLVVWEALTGSKWEEHSPGTARRIWLPMTRWMVVLVQQLHGLGEHPACSLPFSRIGKFVAK